MKSVARQVTFYAIAIGIWVLVAHLHIWPPYLFPPPKEVLQSLWAGFADHSFWIAIAVSMKRIAVGYALSVALGVLLGLLMATSDFLEQTLGGLLVSLQSLPSICWLPMAVLGFGLSEKAILFVVVMGSVLSVTISMETGRKQMPKIYAMAGRNLGAHGLKLFLFVLFPASLPYVLTGLKQRMGVCLALPDRGRDDFRYSGSRPAADDGARPERHEPGACGDDSNCRYRIHRRRVDFQDVRAATAE